MCGTESSRYAGSYADTHWLEGNPQHCIRDDEDTVSKLSLS